MMRLIKKTSLLACMAALILLVGGGSTLAANPANDEMGLISVKFAGGSVTDYFDALIKEAGTINVMLAPEAAEVSMPPVTLTNVSVSAAIDLVDGRSASPPGRVIKLNVRQMPQYQDGALPTYQVRAEVHGGGDQTYTSVWTIAGLLRGDVFDADDVLAAVEAALDILASTKEPIIRFHKETGVLIARGDPGQLSTIKDVLKQLEQSQILMSHKPMQELRDRNVVLGGELMNAKARIGDLTSERDIALGEMRQIRIDFETQIARLAEMERRIRLKDDELLELTLSLRKTQAELDAERRKSTGDRKSGRDNS